MIRKDFNIDIINVGSDIINVRGNFHKVLFGFILMNKGVINFDICKRDIEFQQVKNICSFEEACEIIIREILIKNK